MIESQKELPLRGALSSRHCEERMTPKQSHIKIPGGEENAAWPGQEMFFVIARSPDSSGRRSNLKKGSLKMRQA